MGILGALFLSTTVGWLRGLCNILLQEGSDVPAHIMEGAPSLCALSIQGVCRASI